MASTLKNTSTHSCGITEDVLEVTEKPSEEAKNQAVRSITRTTYSVSDPALASTVLPSPYSLAPPGVATRLTSKFVYDCPTNKHRRQIIKRPMRVSSHSANAINLSFFQEQFASTTGGGPKTEGGGSETDSAVSGALHISKIESEASADEINLKRIGSGLPRKGIEFCSDLEKAIVKEINKVRQKPRAYMIELANRRRELIGSTMWTRRSGAIRLTEGSAAIEEAINALRTTQLADQSGTLPTNSTAAPSGSIVPMEAIKFTGTTPKKPPPPTQVVSPSKSSDLNVADTTIAESMDGSDLENAVESLSSDDNSEYLRGSSSSDEDNNAASSQENIKSRKHHRAPLSRNSDDDEEIEPDVNDSNDHRPAFLRVESSNMSSFKKGASRGKALSMLNVSTGLCLAARDHAKDIGPKGLTTHRGTADESSVRERVERYGVWLESCYEMLSFGIVDAVDLVCQFLVDDGIPGRHHRELMLSNRFGDMGVHVAPHVVFGVVVVIVFAGRFLTLKKSVIKQLKMSVDATRRSSNASGASATGPLEDNVATCPQCHSTVPRNQCVYGPWGEAYHRHCLRCHQCFSTIQNGFYLYDFDLMAPHVQRASEGVESPTIPDLTPVRSQSSSASALRSAVISSRTSAPDDDLRSPSPSLSATSTIPTKIKSDIVPLCPTCYNRLCSDRCVVCGVSCAFANPLKADKMASFQVNQSPACEECFLNEAITMQAVSRGLKKVRR